MKKTFTIIASCIFFATFSISSAFSELISSPEFGYTIDFPEGFEMLDGTADATAYIFKHTIAEISTIIRIWKEDECKDSKTAANATLEKLSAIKEDESIFYWGDRLTTLTKFSMKNSAYKNAQTGWLLSTPLPEKKSFLTLASFAQTEKSYDLEQMILSILDSLIIGENFVEHGAITTFSFPRGEAKTIKISISGKDIETTIDAIDTEANQFVIDREFAVLKVLAYSKFWKESWQRFYRLIAKDSFIRLKDVSKDIFLALYPEAQEKDKENPSAYIAQQLLYWVQGFEYKRISTTKDKADFTPLPAILEGEGSDCDSRSMLLAVILNTIGVNSVVFVSNEYSHAILGVDLPGKQGQSIRVDGTDYLLGETTAKNWTFGLLQATMKDKSKWIPVEFLK